MEDVEQLDEAEVTEDVGGEVVDDPAPEQDADANTGDGGGREAAEPDSWINDEIRELAESYGLADEDLSEFESLAEFRRAAAWLDRELIKPVTERDTEPDLSGTVKEEKESPPVQKADEDQLDLDLQHYINGEYDEGTLNLVKFAKRLRAESEALKAELGSLKPHIEQITQSQQDDMRNQVINAFHDLADDDDAELFGRSIQDGLVVDLPKAHRENRRLVYEAMDTLATGLVARGQSVPPIKVLYQRGKQLALADKLRSRESAGRREAIGTQSRKRRPVAGAARTSGPSSEAKSLADDPRIKAAFERMREQVPGEG